MELKKENFDLRASIATLYETGDYFVQRPFLGDAVFEENYHETAVDPDGVTRNMLSNEEREHKLKNFMPEYLAELSQREEKGVLLDVGCGPGWLLSALDGTVWEKNGIEISKFASNHAKKHGSIFTGSIESYNTTKMFDVVTMHHVIEHLLDPESVILKIHSMLKRGGMLIVGTPNFDSAAARRYGNNFRLLHDDTHVSLFTEDSMHRLLRDCGFKIAKVEYPFFETKFFNKADILKVLDTDILSPPMHGSVMTFFAKKI